jgi:hypothetical protein
MWARLTAEDWRMTPTMHQKIANQSPLIPATSLLAARCDAYQCS